MSIFSIVLLAVAAFYVYMSNDCRSRNSNASDQFLSDAILLIIAAGVWR